MMDLLKESALAFQRLIGSDYIITAQKGEKRICLTIYFERSQYLHLIGLNKLSDIPIFKGNSRSVFQNILDGKITYETIRQSAFFESIRERILFFPEIESLLYNEIILRFDQRKAYSTICATMLLYRKQDDTYLHLFLIRDKAKADTLVPCSFFPRKDNKYIQRQQVYKILSVRKVEHPPVGKSLEDRIRRAKDSSERVTDAHAEQRLTQER